MKWVCTVCGYVHEGPEAPAECPVCHVGADKFIKQDEGNGLLTDLIESSIFNAERAA